MQRQRKQIVVKQCEQQTSKEVKDPPDGDLAGGGGWKGGCGVSGGCSPLITMTSALSGRDKEAKPHRNSWDVASTPRDPTMRGAVVVVVVMVVIHAYPVPLSPQNKREISIMGRKEAVK